MVTEYATTSSTVRMNEADTQKLSREKEKAHTRQDKRHNLIGALGIAQRVQDAEERQMIKRF